MIERTQPTAQDCLEKSKSGHCARLSCLTLQIEAVLRLSE